jgi:hypothetical protein
MNHSMCCVFALLLSLVSSVESYADTILSVDFGISDPLTGNIGSRNDVGLGYFDFASPVGVTGPDQFTTTATITRTIGSFEVDVLRVFATNGITYVDAGDMNSAGALNDVLEDYVAEFGLGIRIRNLTPGSYSITTYHHVLDGLNPRSFGVFRSVGASFNQLATVTTSVGQNPGQISQLTLNFTPDANGSVLFLYGTPVDRGFVNGLTITSVPEPSSIVLLSAIGALACVFKCTRLKLSSRLR